MQPGEIAARLQALRMELTLQAVNVGKDSSINVESSLDKTRLQIVHLAIKEEATIVAALKGVQASVDRADSVR